MTRLNPSTPQEREFISAICNLLEDNVIIPKGTNRHSYADVLHQWIEGAVVLTDSSTKGNYIGRVLEECSIMLNETNYRIKPPDPVYEWQWYYVSDGLKVYTKERHTELEAEENLSPTHVKDEETKRIRE